MLSPDPLPLSLFRPPIVLVVESRTSARTSICRLLRALGYDGRVARDGGQALRMLRVRHENIAVVCTPEGSWRVGWSSEK